MHYVEGSIGACLVPNLDTCLPLKALGSTTSGICTTCFPFTPPPLPQALSAACSLSCWRRPWWSGSLRTMQAHSMLVLLAAQRVPADTHTLCIVASCPASLRFQAPRPAACAAAMPDNVPSLTWFRTCTGDGGSDSRVTCAWHIAHRTGVEQCWPAPASGCLVVTNAGTSPCLQ
jgi:hypothetical protein